MSISKISTRQKWVELGTASPTSGSSVSFSDLPQYANYKLSYFNLDTTSNTVLIDLRINNDSGNNYAYVAIIDNGVTAQAVTNAIRLNNGGTYSANDFSGVVTIGDADDLIKEIDFWSAGATLDGEYYNGSAHWNSQAVINRLDLILTNATFTNGTIKVFGRN